MQYGWAKPGQAVECVKEFTPRSRAYSGGFVPVLGSVYVIAYAGVGPNIETGEEGIGIALEEDPGRDGYGWWVGCFKPVYPQQLAEWRRLARRGGVGAKRRVAEDA